MLLEVFGIVLVATVLTGIVIWLAERKTSRSDTKPWAPLQKPPKLSDGVWRRIVEELWRDCPPPIGFYPDVDRWLHQDPRSGGHYHAGPHADAMLDVSALAQGEVRWRAG